MNCRELDRPLKTVAHVPFLDVFNVMFTVHVSHNGNRSTRGNQITTSRNHAEARLCNRDTKRNLSSSPGGAIPHIPHARAHAKAR